MEEPVHIAVLPLAEIDATGKGVTEMFCVACELPQLLLAVNVYVPAVLTVIESLTEPVLQEKLLVPVVYRTTEPPAQKLLLPPNNIFATGNAFTVMVCEAVDEPHTLEAVTV
jgi:hypothetical protein